MSFRLSDRSRPKFEHYLNRLLSLFDEEAKLTGVNIPNFDLNVYILHHLINSDKSLTSSRLNDLIRATLFEMKRKGFNDEVSFFNVLERQHVRFQGEKPSVYNVVCSTNLDISKLPNGHFSVNNRGVEIIDFAQFEQDFGISSQLDDIHIYGPRRISQLSELSYAAMQVGATSVELARLEGYKTFELFRGILNLSDNYGIFKYQLGRPQVLSRIKPSKHVLVFDEQKKFMDYSYPVVLFDYRPESLTSEKMQFAIELMGKLGSLKDNSLKNRLVSTIIRYNDGLDGNITGTSFISLWQLLEIIALGDQDPPMSEKEVSRRIGAILKEETMRDLMDALRDRRNDLVHDGLISDFDLRDVNLIRLCCEQAILFLLNNIDSFEDEPSLNLFYKHSDLNDTDLARERKILKYLENNQLH